MLRPIEGTTFDIIHGPLAYRWRTAGFRALAFEYRHSTTETIFKQLCADLKHVCFVRFLDAPITPLASANPVTLPRQEITRPLPVYFDDPATQEAFDERAAILEFDAGLSRKEAERRALLLVSQKNPECVGKFGK